MCQPSWAVREVVVPNRRREVRGLLRTGDGQAAGRGDGQSLFNDITGGEGQDIDKGEGKMKEENKRRDSDSQINLRSRRE